MKTSKKKTIIIGSLVILAVIAITLVLLNEWGNREHEKMLEAIRLEQELEAQALEEQQEHQEQEAKELEEQEVTGEGTDVLQGLIEIEPDPTPNTNNSGGGTGTSGGGNSSSNGGGSGSSDNGGSSSNTGNNNSSSSSEELGGPDMDGDGDYDAEDFAALGGGTTGPSEYDPDDMGDVELDWGTP